MFKDIGNFNEVTSVQGRFKFEVKEMDKLYLYIWVSGGFWIESGLDKNLRDQLKSSLFYLKDASEKLVDLHSQLSYLDPPRGRFSEPLDGSLFGDSPDFNSRRQLEWQPITDYLILIKPDQLNAILTGKLNFIVSLYTEKHVFNYNMVSIVQRSRHQVVIAPPSPVHAIVETIKTKGKVVLFNTEVLREQFDQFWTSMYSMYGNNTPAATRASVRAWITRLAFPKDPAWQVLICFLIMGDPMIRNAPIIGPSLERPYLENVQNIF